MKKVTVFTKFSLPAGDFSFEQEFDRIQSDKNKNVILEGRHCLSIGDKEGYDRIKRRLDAFTSGGLFVGGRRLNFLTDYSQIPVLDVDHLKPEQVEEIKARASECDYTRAAFISPSGLGLKIFVQVDTGLQWHKLAFQQLSNYYASLLGVAIDPSGKDVTRLCFESWDPELYYNGESTVYHVDLDQALPGKAKPNNDMELVFADCVEKVMKSHSFTEGQRNTFVFILALMMHRKGVDKTETLEMLFKEHYVYDEQEVLATVNSAYKYHLETPSDARWRYEDGGFGKPAHHKTYAGDAVLMDKVETFLNGLIDHRFNLVTNRLEIRFLDTDDDFIDITDYEENSLWMSLKHADLKLSKDQLHALLNSSFSPRYDPFYDYFAGLPTWDRKTDYIGMLAKTVGAKDSVHLEICLRKWLTAMVASLLDVDVVNHTVIIFTGPQGIGKTTWLLNLVPHQLKKYHYSGMINPAFRDTLMHMVECMMVNVDDLESLTRAEHSALKELITKSGIRTRRVFGINNETLVRRASFCGSVNTGQFLSDTTGNRRFLCIEVVSIDYQHHVDMDLVYSQALALYKSGFQYWFDRKEIEGLALHNDEFVYAPITDELLMVYFEPVKEALRYMDEQYLTDNHILKLTATQIAARLSEFSRIPVNGGSTVSLGKALRKYGFVRFKHRDVYVYLVKEVGL